MNRSTVLLLIALVLAAFGHAADNSEAIIDATKDYVKKETAVKDPLVTVQKMADGYARVQVKSKSGATDPAIAFLKLEKGKWKVLSLGTAFDPGEGTSDPSFSAAVMARATVLRAYSPSSAWPLEN